MSVVFSSLEHLWSEVSSCLSLLEYADPHAALALQPAAEAFFLVYSCELPQSDSAKPLEHPDAAKLIQFAGIFDPYFFFWEAVFIKRLLFK